MISEIDDPRILRILTPEHEDREPWRDDLRRFEEGDATLTRRSAGEASIMALQRLLFFLGYSTSSRGAFAIDGDFGRGTNRGNAQFEFEHGLTREVDRPTLCYDCTWQTAHTNIAVIPDVRVTLESLRAMLAAATEAIDAGEVMCGDFEDALFYLDQVHRRSFLRCKEIHQRYGGLVGQAVARLRDEQGIAVRPEWILSIIRQETAGIVRPRFEQHLLTRMNRNEPQADLVELRHRAMSFGLGQILGDNFRRVGAPSARAMFLSPLPDQVLFVGRFLVASPKVAAVVGRADPTDDDFRTVARYYNGPGFAAHHYDESLASWFREFRTLL